MNEVFPSVTEVVVQFLVHVGCVSALYYFRSESGAPKVLLYIVGFLSLNMAVSGVFHWLWDVSWHFWLAHLMTGLIIWLEMRLLKSLGRDILPR